jgi:hypothetical protein
MALVIRRAPQPPSRQPREWVEILTADPARPNRLVTEVSALGVSLFVVGLLFALSTIIIQPFLLLYHATKYPNLATTSFTSIALAAGALTLVTLAFLFLILRPYLRLLFIAIGVVASLIIVVVVGTFFFLFIREILLWVLVPNGLPRILIAIQDLIQSILYTIKAI